jgi:hypothetical protein
LCCDEGLRVLEEEGEWGALLEGGVGEEGVEEGGAGGGGEVVTEGGVEGGGKWGVAVIGGGGGGGGGWERRCCCDAAGRGGSISAVQELRVDMNLATRGVLIEELCVRKSGGLCGYGWYYEGKSDCEEGHEAPSAGMWSLCIHLAG